MRVEIIIILLIIVGCSKVDELIQPNKQQQPRSVSSPGLKSIIEVQESHSSELMAKEGIIGTGIGLTEEKGPCIVVYAETADHAPVPKRLGGFPVRVVVTGKIRAF